MAFKIGRTAISIKLEQENQPHRIFIQQHNLICINKASIWIEVIVLDFETWTCQIDVSLYMSLLSSVFSLRTTFYQRFSFSTITFVCVKIEMPISQNMSPPPVHDIPEWERAIRGRPNQNRTRKFSSLFFFYMKSKSKQMKSGFNFVAKWIFCTDCQRANAVEDDFSALCAMIRCICDWPNWNITVRMNDHIRCPCAQFSTCSLFHAQVAWIKAAWKENK